MNHRRAYEILGLDPSASLDDVHSKFRKLAKEMHPDRNKEPGAEDKYKELSEAYEFLKSTPKPPPDPFGGMHPGDFLNDIFGGMYPGRAYHNHPNVRVNVRNRVKTVNGAENVITATNVSFIDSVLGCEREVSVERNVKCESCDGIGHMEPTSDDDVCKDCNGAGQTVKESKSPGFSMRQIFTCPTCSGTGRKRRPCEDCSGSGSSKQSFSCKVKIPPGTTNGDILAVRGKGHFLNLNMNAFAQGDILVSAVVGTDPDMTMEGINVISTIKLSLYEALAGTTKKVRTVFGTKDIGIKPGIKNGDHVSLSEMGVGSYGKHIFNIVVDYPENCEELIEFLKKEETKE